MNRWKVILAVSLIFTTGVATGVFSFRAVVRTHPPRGDTTLPPTVFDSRFDFLAKLKQDLALDPDQAKTIDGILQEGRKRMHELWKAAEPPMREEMKSVRERIQATLTPAQREKFDEMLKRSRERRGPKPSADGTNAAPRKEKERDKSPPRSPGTPEPQAGQSPPAPAQTPVPAAAAAPR